METLYKTNAPEQLDRAEYYQPRIEQKFYDGKWRFIVTEKHGWYDDGEGKVVHHMITLDPSGSEGFDSIEEAWRRYQQQIDRRVADGFKHSFSIEFDPDKGLPVQLYKKLA